MADKDEAPRIPELDVVEKIVRANLPEGHRLDKVDLSFGSLEEGDEPRFLVLIELRQTRHAPEPFGWANEMTKIIREHCSRENFDIKLKILIE